MELSWAYVLVPFLSAGAGAYLGGYLKKKGENLATHEDIDKLNAQVRAVTMTTEDIKAKISNEVWDRQKRWEMKREVLFEASKRLVRINEALIAAGSALGVSALHRNEQALRVLLEAKTKWTEASAGFDEARLLVDVVCEKETRDAFTKFNNLVSDIGHAMVVKNERTAYLDKMSEINEGFAALRAAIRKELGSNEV
jgi:hypothetical protein